MNKIIIKTSPYEKPFIKSCEELAELVDSTHEELAKAYCSELDPIFIGLKYEHSMYFILYQKSQKRKSHCDFNKKIIKCQEIKNLIKKPIKQDNIKNSI